MRDQESIIPQARKGGSYFRMILAAGPGKYVGLVWFSSQKNSLSSQLERTNKYVYIYIYIFPAVSCVLGELTRMKTYDKSIYFPKGTRYV